MNLSVIDYTSESYIWLKSYWNQIEAQNEKSIIFKL